MLQPNEVRFGLNDLREAQHGLKGIAARTPLIDLDGFAAAVQLKAEYLQPIHAFKIRGAWTAVRRLSPEIRQQGVITTSSGNHGLGIAWAAHRFGIPAVIVMPRSASRVKIQGVRQLGAEVLLAGESRGVEQDQAAAELVEKRGLTLIPPYDHPDVIAGQASVAMEILQQRPDLTTLAVPVGGGGLLAGTCCAVRALQRDVQIIAVEPASVPKLSAAMAHGGPLQVDPGSSLADGLLTRSIGSLTWPLLRDTVSNVISVTDNEIEFAMDWLASRNIRIEPSASVTLAALLEKRIACTGPTVLVATGGNIDPDYWRRSPA